MDKVKQKKKSIRDVRIWMQLAFVTVSNGYFKGFVEGKIFTGVTKSACLPGLNCYSCPGALGACPIGSLQGTLGSYSYKMAFYVIGMLTVFGALLGRFVCGFLCPFGLVQDLLDKIPFTKKIKTFKGDRLLRSIKYVILGLLVVILPMIILDVAGQGKPWFCEYVCPSGTLFAGIPLISANKGLQAIVGGLFAWKMIILVGIVLLSVVIYRPFCKYICPLGAIYGFFNPIALYRFQVVEKKCTKCKSCRCACKMNIHVEEKPNSLECIRCGDCKRACPTGAIENVYSFRKGKKHLAGEEV